MTLSSPTVYLRKCIGDPPSLVSKISASTFMLMDKLARDFNFNIPVCDAQKTDEPFRHKADLGMQVVVSVAPNTYYSYLKMSMIFTKKSHGADIALHDHYDMLYDSDPKISLFLFHSVLLQENA